MNVASYNSVDFVNGEGSRVSLFVSGCDHACRGCYNKKTWNKNFGKKFTDKMASIIIQDLTDTDIIRDGISLTGGDPLFSENIPTIYKLINRIKKEAPLKNIWLWSGYTLKEINKNKNLSEIDLLRFKIIGIIDVFIDGRFIKEKASVDLKWRGSSNQIIHVKNANSPKG